MLHVRRAVSVVVVILFVTAAATPADANHARFCPGADHGAPAGRLLYIESATEPPADGVTPVFVDPSVAVCVHDAVISVANLANADPRRLVPKARLARVITYNYPPDPSNPPGEGCVRVGFGGISVDCRVAGEIALTWEWRLDARGAGQWASQVLVIGDRDATITATVPGVYGTRVTAGPGVRYYTTYQRTGTA